LGLSVHPWYIVLVDILLYIMYFVGEREKKKKKEKRKARKSKGSDYGSGLKDY